MRQEGGTSEKEEVRVIKGVRSLMDQCLEGGRGDHEDRGSLMLFWGLREVGEYMGWFQGGREPRLRM